jgi:carbon storage regulator
MLILTRKSDESIIIGNNIKVKVLKVQGNQVHLGIDAPRDFSIFREEIFEQIRAENANAVQNDIEPAKLAELEDCLTGLKNLLFSEDEEQEPETGKKN